MHGNCRMSVGSVRSDVSDRRLLDHGFIRVKLLRSLVFIVREAAWTLPLKTSNTIFAFHSRKELLLLRCYDQTASRQERGNRTRAKPTRSFSPVKMSRSNPHPLARALRIWWNHRYESLTTGFTGKGKERAG